MVNSVVKFCIYFLAVNRLMWHVVECGMAVNIVIK